MSKGNPQITFRVSTKENVALRALAAQNRKQLAVYMRKVVVRKHLEGETTQSLGETTHLQNLSRLAKEYVIRARLSRQPSKVPMKETKDSGLPGSPHRDDLEDLAWKAVQEAVSYSKTEAAANDAEARLLALRIANGLMRTELAILKAQDDAYVDALLEELGVDADGLAAKTQKSR